MKYRERLGRFCNHDPMSIANAQAEYIEVDGEPAIILVAKKTIEVGDEIRYDYGDKDRKTRSLFPFLAPAGRFIFIVVRMIGSLK